MAYLEFLREQVDAPVPRVVLILGNLQDWISVQITDEIRDLWPGCVIKLAESPSGQASDIVVIPFQSKSPADIMVPVTTLTTGWVMLYGLQRRRIWLLPRKEAISLVLRARRLRTLRKNLAKARIVRPFKWGIQLWKRYCCQ